LFVLLCVGYALGYRPGPSFTFVRAGTLVLTNVPVGGIVYADETKRAVSTGKDIRLTLVPGNHSIILDVKGDNPWSDTVNIAARTDTTVSPISVPLSVRRSVLEDTDMAKANAAFAAFALPTAAKPLVFADGCVNVSVSNNRILATMATSTSCAPEPYLCVGGTCATTVVFAPVAKLHSVIQYPGRQDALIVGYGDTLAVLELNPLKPQFFAPLIKGGVAPIAAPWGASSIVVRDEGRTFTIGL
jgi:hypothetical protein